MFGFRDEWQCFEALVFQPQSRGSGSATPEQLLLSLKDPSFLGQDMTDLKKIQNLVSDLREIEPDQITGTACFFIHTSLSSFVCAFDS